ncbi:glycosyl hydrolase [Parahaliea mediterranea]|uniref:glycosyl hydrolase n=1 Tax=Parahaliea mediterranea TaxID=651086 RepID=UPI000E2F4162|nr:glycosyl hydrolase [Parahaliea mediterranea]
MLRKLSWIVGGLALLALLLIAGAGGWAYQRLNQALVPPANPANAPSIATYSSGPEPVATNRPGQAELVAPVDWQTLATPPQSAMPWTRWWWPGGDVDSAVASTQLDRLQAAGFGGVEIQPFLSGMINVADDETVMSRVYSFDTPAYYTTLNATIAHAETLGMQVDLTHFSGWPPGGPEILLEDSVTALVYGSERVSGGGSVSMALPEPQPGPSERIFSMLEFAGADFINFPADQARLLSVTAARVVDGGHAWSPFNVADTVALDADSLTVLTDKVSDGELNWQAPEGDWEVIANYLMPSGEVPMGAAQKPQGFVVDHLRTPQVLGHYEYAYGERTGLAQHYGKGLRGFFNDSLEFRITRMGVVDILPEFARRRGYDLEPWLPVIHVEGTDNVYFRELLGVHAGPEFSLTDGDERIRWDYQKTLSDLMIERFVQTSANWAENRGLISRGQSYGMDIDLLRAMGSNTIVETEQLWAGGANVGLKFASSAAALYGRPLVSAESFVWINRDYQPTARRLKAAADKLLLAGVNHIIYHGTPYPWQGSGNDYGEEGWQPFSGPQNPAHFSGLYSAANTSLWPDIPALNQYIGRSQHLLRQGAPSLDVLVYYPFLGFHGPNMDREGEEVLVSGSLPDADPANVMLEDPALAEGKAQLMKLMTVPEKAVDPRVAWMESVQPLLDALDRHGITWGWVNDHALQMGKVEHNRLTAAGGRYGSVLVANVEVMEPATLSALQKQLADGVPVVFAGDVPTRQPSFLDAEAGDASVRKGVERLLAGGAVRTEFVPLALASMLQKASVPSLRYQSPSSIRRIRRQLAAGGEVHFFANQAATAATAELSAPPEGSWWFDARTGAIWPVQDGADQLLLALAPWESRFLVAGVAMPDNALNHAPAEKRVADGPEALPLQSWMLLANGQQRQLDALFDWRDNEGLRFASGPVHYQHTVKVSSLQGTTRFVLDLGLVQGGAQVTVNGQRIGRASLPPSRIDITDALEPGDNLIDIAITAPLRNAFVGKGLAEDPLYSHMKVYQDQLVAAGLLGPVQLHQIKEPSSIPQYDDQKGNQGGGDKAAADQE